jgi:hypothetical protein
MKKNVGKADRSIRIALGVLAILLGFIFQSWWGVIGVPLVITALIGWCPVYVPLSISTCRSTNNQ